MQFIEWCSEMQISRAQFLRSAKEGSSFFIPLFSAPFRLRGGAFHRPRGNEFLWESFELTAAGYFATQRLKLFFLREMPPPPLCEFSFHWNCRNWNYANITYVCDANVKTMIGKFSRASGEIINAEPRVITVSWRANGARLCWQTKLIRVNRSLDNARAHFNNFIFFM